MNIELSSKLACKIAFEFSLLAPYQGCIQLVAHLASLPVSLARVLVTFPLNTPTCNQKVLTPDQHIQPTRRPSCISHQLLLSSLLPVVWLPQPSIFLPMLFRRASGRGAKRQQGPAVDLIGLKTGLTRKKGLMAPLVLGLAALAQDRVLVLGFPSRTHLTGASLQ